MFWDQILTIIVNFRIPDLLDILLVAFILYNLIKLIRETRAFQLAKGFVLLGIVYVLILSFNMTTSEFIFQKLFSDLIILIIILFQPEIRHALESVGGSKLTRLSLLGGSRSENAMKNEIVRDTINETCKACNDFSRKKTGAIIVFENKTLLGDVINSGTLIDAKATKELIGNIFFPMSPLHDGAAIIRNGRICAAGCILPLTRDNTISRDLGTRHRAAIGLSEESDAVTVVVSEETGHISVAIKGNLERNLTDAVLREKLIDCLLFEQGTIDSESSFVKRFFGGHKK